MLTAESAAGQSAAFTSIVAIVTAVCWALTLYGATTMSGAMLMPGGWQMSMAWMRMPGQSTLGAAVMFLVMWQLMMVAMMLPSVYPMLLLYSRLASHRGVRGHSAPSIVVVASGYFVVWLIFGVVAYVIGLWVAGQAMRSAAVSRAIPTATGLALLAAGAYQLSGWKQLCLSHCRSPLSFFATHWREGWHGAWRLGTHHGLYCVACCWALMLIQLSLGVMNLLLMLAVALVILLEKVWRAGPLVAKVTGAITVAAGVALIVVPLFYPPPCCI